jgi:hypothetical protein
MGHSAYRYFRENAHGYGVLVELTIGAAGVGVGSVWVNEWNKLGCATYYDNGKKGKCMPHQFKKIF